MALITYFYTRLSLGSEGEFFSNTHHVETGTTLIIWTKLFKLVYLFTKEKFDLYMLITNIVAYFFFICTDLLGY